MRAPLIVPCAEYRHAITSFLAGRRDCSWWLRSSSGSDTESIRFCSTCTWKQGGHLESFIGHAIALNGLGLVALGGDPGRDPRRPLGPHPMPDPRRVASTRLGLIGRAAVRLAPARPGSGAFALAGRRSG